ncbi:MAG: helix-turn-helix transcriptional regulator [Halohasta sp.]
MIRLVTRREGLLRRVGTDGLDKRELVEELSVSRSTVDRGIRELESAGLLARSADGYHRTLFGELLLTEYDSFASTTEALLTGHELLADLPPGFDLDPTLLEDAHIVTASQYAPHQPISALCSLLTDARWVQTVFPAVFPQVFGLWSTLDDEEMIRADIVVTEPVVTKLVSAHSETLQTLLDESRLSVHQVDADPTYGLIVAEREESATAGLVVLDERGGARAFIETDAEAAVSWVRERIDHHLMQSTPLSPQSVDGG